MADYAGKLNQQVKAFNESLPAQIKVAFAAKLDELTQQYAVFDELDIPEQPEAQVLPTSSTPAKPKTAKARAVHITQYIDTMFVQKLY
jgi:hypothetical protein